MYQNTTNIQCLWVIFSKKKFIYINTQLRDEHIISILETEAAQKSHNVTCYKRRVSCPAVWFRSCCSPVKFSVRPETADQPRSHKSQTSRKQTPSELWFKFYLLKISRSCLQYRNTSGIAFIWGQQMLLKREPKKKEQRCSCSDPSGQMQYCTASQGSCRTDTSTEILLSIFTQLLLLNLYLT